MKRIKRYSIRLASWVGVVLVLMLMYNIKDRNDFIPALIQAMILTVITGALTWVGLTWWYLHDIEGFQGDKLLKKFYNTDYFWLMLAGIILFFFLLNSGDSIIFLVAVAVALMVSLSMDMPENLHMKIQKAIDRHAPADDHHGHGDDHGHDHEPRPYYSQDWNDTINANIQQKDGQSTVTTPLWYSVRLIFLLIAFISVAELIVAPLIEHIMKK